MLLSIVDFIGRFHPLLVHLPIGVLLLALLLQWLSRKEQYTLAHGALKIIWGIGIVSALLSCITGYMLSLKGEYDENTVALHMWAGIGVAAVSLLIGAKVFARQYDAVYKGACVALLLLIIATGHFGGSLTHGDDYLTSALNDGDETATPEIIKPISNVQEANIYADVVQPILQSKCYNCHGAKKQKGKLRMDSPEWLLKGGEDGKVIEPGKGDESEMIKSILLPEEDDDHMPPKGKPQLKEKQIALLHWWIDQGAPFDKKVKDLQQDEKIKPILASLQSNNDPKKDADLIPSTAVKPADAKALHALKEKGIIVLPVAQNSNYLMASFISAPTVSNEEIKLLLPIKEQLIWLKLNDTQIGDEAMQIIAQCGQLRTLQLNNTQITDKGLLPLNRLAELRSLYLVGTNVTSKGLMQLNNLHKLRGLYIYQTKFDGADWQQLKTVFKNTTIDTGGYMVPTLASDTTEVKFVGK